MIDAVSLKRSIKVDNLPLQSQSFRNNQPFSLKRLCNHIKLL